MIQKTVDLEGSRDHVDLDSLRRDIHHYVELLYDPSLVLGGILHTTYNDNGVFLVHTV